MAIPTKRVCATMDQHYHLAAVDAVYRDNRRALESFTAARLKKRTTVLKIPVVVHVLFNTDAENLSEEQVNSQIAALNRDYRNGNPPGRIPKPFRALASDTLIEFALAVRDPEGRRTTGITRKKTSKAVFPYDQFDKEATAKLDKLVKFDEFGRAAWPRDNYLNLWTCSLGGDLLGYAQFPGGPAETDGVVILNSAFGTTGTAAVPGNVFNLGRTATHEVGHWLNLLHIWGDDRDGCTGSDNVTDTPNQASSNGGRPAFPHVTCNNAPDGDMFMNYMDYVDDDAMFMFTKGQVERMDATVAGARRSLADSEGLTPVPNERLKLPKSKKGATTAMASRAKSSKGKDGARRFDGVSWVPQP